MKLNVDLVVEIRLCGKWQPESESQNIDESVSLDSKGERQCETLPHPLFVPEIVCARWAEVIE